MTSLRKSCMFQKTKVWACCLHFWYFVAFGISCTLCKHQKSSRSFWNDTMSSITIYLYRVMFYIRRFKRCSEAICVQDPNVGMLKSDDELFLDSSLQWPCNYVQVLVKFVSPSSPDSTYSCASYLYRVCMSGYSLLYLMVMASSLIYDTAICDMAIYLQ
jgi:hypothetical protein